VFDFNTQTAAGSWNSLYVFAILIASVLMAALVWSFGSSEEAGGSTNSNSEEVLLICLLQIMALMSFQKKVITYDDQRKYSGAFVLLLLPLFFMFVGLFCWRFSVVEEPK